MFIRNPSVNINSKLSFPCKSTKLLKFLTQIKGLMYVARVVDPKDQRYIWLFTRTDDLAAALLEWKENKESGNLAFSKQE